MKILVIGSGGREHAIAWKLAQSKRVQSVYVSPGNGGTSNEQKIKNIQLQSIDETINFVTSNNISFTIVGPEVPLAQGIVDTFNIHNLKIWGPNKFCAMLESSKVFAKNFMQKYNIPTAKYASFTNENDALQYLENTNFPLVIKADSLASGKGVLVTDNLKDAKTFIHDIFSINIFNAINPKVVIEEFLDGVEASFIVMIDGKNILPLASSQDHKRLLNNDLGPNTGGMGVFSPTPIVNDQLAQNVIETIIKPTMHGIENEGNNYRGFLYAGLMIDKNNNIKVLEFNCRLGDPETQAILMRLDNDFVDLIEAGLNQTLDIIHLKWLPQVAVGVVLASKNYPYDNSESVLISGLDKIDNDTKVFHCATHKINNEFYTNGGRILCVVSLGNNMQDAIYKVYNEINHIHFNGMQYRTDIAAKIV